MFLKKHKYTIILVLVVLIVVGYGGVKWYEGRMKLVERGMADQKFPFHEYTLLELVRVKPVGDFNDEDRVKFMQQLRDLSTRTAPKETFDIYIQALKDGDIERALECCIEKEPERNDEHGKELKDLSVSWKVSESDRKYLYWIKDKGYLSDMIQKLEEIRTEINPDLKKIEKGSTGELEILYKEVQCGGLGDGFCFIAFTKDFWGDWKIASPRL